jgi:NodT family efflux transporter outer membrane factor (OMF) lipoprotein
MNRALASLPLIATLAACSVGPDYRPPELPTASTWSIANTEPRAGRAEYWRAFNDPVLDKLVAQALAGNPDIDVALARIDQARAGAQAAGAALLPAAQTQGSLARSRQSLAAGIGQLSRYVPDFPRTADQAELGIAASWDIDFAGGQRRNREAARADVARSEAGLAAAHLAVSAELIDTYLGYRGAQAQLATLVAQRTLLADRRRIMAARLRYGEVPRAALDQMDAALADIDALEPLVRAGLVTARHRIVILTGRPAGTPMSELDPMALVPLAGNPAAGAPGDLLRSRPDLLSAEQSLRAANARIGAALAEYWPKLSLAGLIGFDSNDLGRFGGDASSVIQGALGLRWRLFDFGRVDALVDQARGAEREALAAYRSAVLKAGEQVESSFVRLAAEQAALDQRLLGQTAMIRAEQSAKAAFHAGEISRDALHVAEIARLEADDGVTASRTALARAILACHRALGG